RPRRVAPVPPPPAAPPHPLRPRPPAQPRYAPPVLLPAARARPGTAVCQTHPIRHRGGRLGGRRQIDHGPRAARTAGPLARHSPRRTHHHRRLPLPQCRAPTPPSDRPEGLPRVLRPAQAAEIHLGRQGRIPRGPCARVLPPHLRHRPRRRGGRPLPRCPHRRRPQRPPAGPSPPRRHP